MLFGKRDKKTPNSRVEDLKARVDALRHADQASRTRPPSLDQFLEGDDVLTGREIEDNYQPTGFAPGTAPSSPPANEYEAALAAELEKYILREEERALQKQPSPEAATAGTEPPPLESTSLLLDGTWSRDAQRRANLTAADRAWRTPEQATPAPADDGPPPTASSAESPSEAPREQTRDAWDWRAEDELPPRQETL